MSIPTSVTCVTSQGERRAAEAPVAIEFLSALADKSRVMTASRAATSCGVVWCGRNQPFCCHSCKLIFVSDEEHFAVAHDGREKMVTGAELCRKFVGCIDAWIDVAAKPSLRLHDRPDERHEQDVSDYHQIDVAGCAILAAGD